jgi:hypothetical protein
LNEVEFLLKNLRKNKPLTELFGGEADKSGINLKLDDLYFDDEPIRMSAELVKAFDYPDSLTAIIENIETGQVFSGSFTPQIGGWQMLRDPLPKGNYRVTVGSGSSSIKISPVNGLFLVASRLDLNNVT